MQQQQFSCHGKLSNINLPVTGSVPVALKKILSNSTSKVSKIKLDFLKKSCSSDNTWFLNNYMTHLLPVYFFQPSVILWFIEIETTAWMNILCLVSNYCTLTVFKLHVNLSYLGKRCKFLNNKIIKTFTQTVVFENMHFF